MNWKQECFAELASAVTPQCHEAAFELCISKPMNHAWCYQTTLSSPSVPELTNDIDVGPDKEDSMFRVWLDAEHVGKCDHEH